MYLNHGKQADCIFCGATLTSGNRSGEHVVKKSILEALNHLNTPCGLRHTRGIQELETRIPTFNQLRNHYVCSECNSGWMNKQDQAIEPLIIELARGHFHTTSNAENRALARWLLRTAISFRLSFTGAQTWNAIAVARKLQADPGYLPRGFIALLTGLPPHRHAAIGSANTWSGPGVATMQHGTPATLKFAVHLDCMLAACAMVSMAEPMFGIPHYASTLALIDAGSVQRQVEPVPLEVYAANGYEPSPSTEIQLQITLLGCRPRQPSECWP